MISAVMSPGISIQSESLPRARIRAALSSALNLDTKRDAIDWLERAAARHEALRTLVEDGRNTLQRARRATSRELILAVEEYVNRLASSPKELCKSIGEYRVASSSEADVVNAVKSQSHDADRGGRLRVLASVGLGAAATAVAPAAAVSVASTLGTAATGTAIATLSGAAQTSAAMAWIGGGALSAGGGGMVAGAQVLAVLGGPVAWGLGGLALCGTAALTRRENGRIARRAIEATDRVATAARDLRRVRRSIRALINLTQQHAAGVRAQLRWLERNASADYDSFSDDQKRELGALINSVRALTELLNAPVS